jgi:hypothetical protein
MNTPDQVWWARARAARDRLEMLIIRDPDVRMISIGLDPERRSDTPVLIVHIRQSAATPASIPSEIDDIPVRVVYGDYHIERGGT